MNTETETAEQIEKAEAAIAVVLERIRHNVRVRQVMGPATETFRLLTEAYAALAGITVAAARELALNEQGKEAA